VVSEQGEPRRRAAAGEGGGGEREAPVCGDGGDD
jgi:hypothetical protein